MGCGGSKAVMAANPKARPQALRPVVLTGPSGAGKSTLIESLQKEFVGVFGFSVSHTTRGPRPGEVDGIAYHFTSRDVMDAGIAAGDFVEHAEFSGNLYGTSKKAIQDVVDNHLVPLLDIEKNGCEQVRKTDMNCLFISILPPSLDILEKRLRDRGTETEEKIMKRIKLASDAVEYGKDPKKIDVIIVNDDKDKAYAQLREALLPLISLAMAQQKA